MHPRVIAVQRLGSPRHAVAVDPRWRRGQSWCVDADQYGVDHSSRCRATVAGIDDQRRRDAGAKTVTLTNEDQPQIRMPFPHGGEKMVRLALPPRRNRIDIQRPEKQHPAQTPRLLPDLRAHRPPTPPRNHPRRDERADPAILASQTRPARPLGNTPRRTRTSAHHGTPSPHPPIVITAGSDRAREHLAIPPRLWDHGPRRATSADTGNRSSPNTVTTLGCPDDVDTARRTRLPAARPETFRLQNTIPAKNTPIGDLNRR